MTQELNINTFELVQFLKLFDPAVLSQFSTPKNHISNVPELKLSDFDTTTKLKIFEIYQSRLLNKISQENANLAEKVNEIRAEEQTRIQETGRNLVIQELESYMLLEIIPEPKSWEEFLQRFKKFLARYKVFELLEQAESTTPPELAPNQNKLINDFVQQNNGKYKDTSLIKLEWYKPLKNIHYKSIDLQGLQIWRSVYLLSGQSPLINSLKFKFDEYSYFSIIHRSQLGGSKENGKIIYVSYTINLKITSEDNLTKAYSHISQILAKHSLLI